MKVLFVHNHFPGQFLHVAKALSKMAKVAAIGSAVEPESLADIQLLPYEVADKDLSAAHPFARRFEAECRRVEQVLYAAMALKRSGFVPDVTIVHPGWGEALPIRDLFPQTKLFAHCEYFYNPVGADVGFDPEFPQEGLDSHVRIRLYNAATLLSLVEADRLFSPTRWQRQLFPHVYQSSIEVIHEGIDVELAKPNHHAAYSLGSRHLLSSDEVVTFAARDLEPYRGYHILMRALPAVLRQRPKAQVLLVGGNGVSYGAQPPSGVTWKDVFLREVAADLDLSRVHFLGTLQHCEFVKVLQISSVHVYLTYPFVLSWSVLEAMSAGCLVIGSDTPPVREILQHGSNGLLTPFFEPDLLADTIVRCLATPDRFSPLRDAARRTVLEKYDSRQCVSRMLDYIRS